MVLWGKRGGRRRRGERGEEGGRRRGKKWGERRKETDFPRLVIVPWFVGFLPGFTPWCVETDTAVCEAGGPPQVLSSTFTMWLPCSGVYHGSLGICKLWRMNQKYQNLLPSTQTLPSTGKVTIFGPPHSTMTQQLSTLQFPMAMKKVIIALDM